MIFFPLSKKWQPLSIHHANLLRKRLSEPKRKFFVSFLVDLNRFGLLNHCRATALLRDLSIFCEHFWLPIFIKAGRKLLLLKYLGHDAYHTVWLNKLNIIRPSALLYLASVRSYKQKMNAWGLIIWNGLEDRSPIWVAPAPPRFAWAWSAGRIEMIID